MSYNVKLDVFEGPLDLLLFFIKRDEINIYDIPISYITQEYLEYLDIMKSMNLHLAGEFILMASLLMRIKVQMLLPREKVDNEELIEDPRTELIQMLVEYQKYREAGTIFKNLEEKQNKFYPVKTSSDTISWDPGLFLADVHLVDLGIAFRNLLESMPKTSYYQIETYKININQQAQILRTMFADKKRIKFSNVAVMLKNRIEVVVTFLAILEMVKSEEISISQKTIFGDIYLTKIQLKDTNVIADT
ncbi:segregation/condensation protein A [bacterium]|nr:segregation/condensation protein A [bacterium]MBU1635941.1 segregation/condensation protein A [bacterium]MBU1875025.1 segregation/condensation protein A [bacterium]